MIKLSVISFLVSVWLSFNSYSEATNAFSFITNACVISVPRSNVVAIFKNSEPGALQFPADKPIFFGFLSMTNMSYQMFTLSPEYGFRIEATSETGLPVAKTWKGKQYGDRFDEIQEISKKRALDMKWVRGHNVQDAPYWTEAPQTMPLIARQFPIPQDLFKFDKPGVYTLTIELQCFYSDNISLLRFRPVKIQIVETEADVLLTRQSLYRTFAWILVTASAIWITRRIVGRWFKQLLRRR